MLLFCDVARQEQNRMIWDCSVLKSICVSFINIIIFVRYLLIDCILNFCFVLSFVFSLFLFSFCCCFCFCLCLCLCFCFFFCSFIYFVPFYWVFSLSDNFSCVFEHVPLLSTTVLPLYDMQVASLSLAQALEQQ